MTIVEQAIANIDKDGAARTAKPDSDFGFLATYTFPGGMVHATEDHDGRIIQCFGVMETDGRLARIQEQSEMIRLVCAVRSYIIANSAKQAG